MTKVCTCCGKEYETEKPKQRLCSDCRKQHRKEHTKYVIQYRKEKRHQVLISKEDYAILKTISDVTGMSVRETIHEIIHQKVLTS